MKVNLLDFSVITNFGQRCASVNLSVSQAGILIIIRSIKLSFEVVKSPLTDRINGTELIPEYLLGTWWCGN